LDSGATPFSFVRIELASHQMLCVHRWNGAEYFDLFIADSVAMQRSGRPHGQKSYKLKHMVPDYIAYRPGGVVKLTPPLDVELFRQQGSSQRLIQTKNTSSLEQQIVYSRFAYVNFVRKAMLCDPFAVRSIQ
jgi:hypothetical protein